MRTGMRAMLAAVVGVAGWAGAATAQAPAPAAPVVAAGGGCATCGGGGAGGGTTGLFRIGAGCANTVGCTTYATERTFLWGSCKQFYNPGNDCNVSIFGNHGLGQGHGGLGHGGSGCCPRLPPGPGGLGTHNPCQYGSIMLR